MGQLSSALLKDKERARYKEREKGTMLPPLDLERYDKNCRFLSLASRRDSHNIQ